MENGKTNLHKKQRRLVAISLILGLFFPGLVPLTSFAIDPQKVIVAPLLISIILVGYLNIKEMRH